MLRLMHAGGVGFATITHAAGISSTGDDELDRRLPFDEPYHIPETTADAIRTTHAGRGRVIAIGTTVVRALEHAAVAGRGKVRAGPGLANQRITAFSTLRVVQAILSGVHEPGTSHYELLRAFTDDGTLDLMSRELDSHDFRSHEFGDSVLIERRTRACKVVC
jgi:S-adenosylmethionine:tRNA ribosyltransferase-isomerase